MAEGEDSPSPQGQGRAIYCAFIAWVVCPEPAGGTDWELGAGWGSGHTQCSLCACPRLGKSAVPYSLHRRFPAWIYPSGLSEGRGCLPIKKELRQPQPLAPQHLVCRLSLPVPGSLLPLPQPLLTVSPPPLPFSQNLLALAPSSTARSFPSSGNLSSCPHGSLPRPYPSRLWWCWGGGWVVFAAF